jgi:glycosyltransferase involved in cell wall biosynthesis
MRRGGHDVSLITSTKASAGGAGVSIYRGRWNPRGTRALADLIRGLRPDVVVVQYVPHAFSPRGGGLPFALLLRAVARSTRVPFIVNAHEIYGGWGESIRRLPWHLSQRLAAMVLIHSSSAFVVTVLKRQIELSRLFRAGRAKVHLLPIGPTILAAEPNRYWRAKHGVSEGTIVVATLGLGHPTHDTTQFARVLDIAVEQRVDLRLFVGGQLQIEHPLATNLGYLDSLSASHLLSACDIFALPLTDGISGRRSSAVSALASGAVIVSTFGTDTDPGLFQHSGIVLTPAGDVDQFAVAVLGIAKDKSERERLKSQSQDFYRENFAWETIALKWETLLKTVHDEG